MNVVIKNIKYYLPSNIEDGSNLEKDNPDWDIEQIEEKTGIKKRHVSSSGQTALDMSVIAAESLFKSQVNTTDIDFLIFVTQSPDYILPTSACILQEKLKLKKTCIAFDVNLGCSGFVYGLAVGSSMIESGLAKGGLLICSDTYTKYINKNDRTCRPIFSDGASITYLTKASKKSIGPFEFGTDGSGAENLMVSANGSRNPNKNEVSQLHMMGSSVFMFSMSAVPKCVKELLRKANLEKTDIDLFIFHQASKLVIDNIMRALELPREKVFTNYQNIGNTVSASIPIALNDANNKGILNHSDKVMLVGFGVGYSWGGCIIEWNSI